MKKLFALMGCSAGLFSFTLSAYDHAAKMREEAAQAQQDVKDAANHTKKAAHEAKEELKENASNAVDALKEKASEIKATAHVKAEEVATTVEEKAAVAKNAVQQKANNISGTLNNTLPPLAPGSENVQVVVEEIDAQSPVVRVWVSGLTGLNEEDLHLMIESEAWYTNGVLIVDTKKAYYK